MSSEAVLQQEIRLALGLRDDIMMFRINVGMFRPLEGNQRRIIRSAPEGTPDLLGVMSPGRAFGIEVKAPKGRQREAQTAWQEAWEKRGGIYILARSLADVYKGLDITP
jgi:VRR-NUC domain